MECGKVTLTAEECISVCYWRNGISKRIKSGNLFAYSTILSDFFNTTQVIFLKNFLSFEQRLCSICWWLHYNVIDRTYRLLQSKTMWWIPFHCFHLNLISSIFASYCGMHIFERWHSYEAMTSFVLCVMYSARLSCVQKDQIACKS